MKIIDNFLHEQYFEYLKGRLFHPHFAYYHQNQKVDYGDGGEQFTHLFFADGIIKSTEIKLLEPIFELLKTEVSKLIRVKLNLQIIENEIKPSMFHTDNTIENATTAIFYLNTNNGKTLFKNGKEVKSVANRIVIFPSNLEHAGTTHTDTKYRMVLNINYK